MKGNTVFYPSNPPAAYTKHIARLENTARQLGMQEKMASFAKYKYDKTSLNSLMNKYLQQGMRNYEKTGMVSPGIEKSIGDISRGLKELPEVTMSVDDIMRIARGWK